MKVGYIKLHRSIMDNFLYNEKRVFSRYEAWQDILLNVNFESGKVMIKGKLYEVKAGQSLLSMDSWPLAGSGAGPGPAQRDRQVSGDGRGHPRGRGDPCSADTATGTAGAFREESGTGDLPLRQG